MIRTAEVRDLIEWGDLLEYRYARLSQLAGYKQRRQHALKVTNKHRLIRILDRVRQASS